MEKSDVVLNVDNIKGVGSSKHDLILDRARRSGNVLDTRADSAVDVVGKGEKCIRGEGNIRKLANPLASLGGGQGSGTSPSANLEM